jgi:DNA polymerase alpha subunit A
LLAFLTGGRREVGRSKNLKLSALERLKKVRSGEANVRDEIKDEEDVYDIVDEDKYSELVHQRQKDDWIVNDGNEAGYYEDGREIFEDYEEDNDDRDVDDDPVASSSRKKKVPLRRATAGEQKKLDLKKKSSIKSFFGPGRSKDNEKKFESVEINDEDFINGILTDIHSSAGKESQFTTKSISTEANREISNRIAKRKFASTATDEQSTSHNPFVVETSRRDPKKRKHTDSDREDDTLIDMPDMEDAVPIERETKVKSERIEKSVKVEMEDGFDDFTESMDCLDDDQLQSAHDTSIHFSFDNATQSNNTANYAINLKSEMNENLEFTTDDAGNKLLHFFWLDAYEDVKEPGVLYLFGKVFVKSLDRYVSCCIICQNVERKLLIYPRSFNRSNDKLVVTMKNVDDELRERLLEYKIKNFRRKAVSKMYAFDKDIATKSDYMELLVDAKRTIPSDLQGDTFHCVFGANQSAMERFLLELNLKGPCWLTIKNPELNSPQISWCKSEYVCNTPFAQIAINHEMTTQNGIPPLTLMTISLKTFMNPNTKQNEILSISCLCNREFYIEGGPEKAAPRVDLHFCIMAKPSSSSQLIFPYDFTGEKVSSIYRKTKVEIAGSEREALNLFLAKITLIDPDILVGHDIYGFDLDTLLSRIGK